LTRGDSAATRPYRNDADKGRLRITWRARDSAWKLDGESLFALLERTVQLVCHGNPHR